VSFSRPVHVYVPSNPDAVSDSANTTAKPYDALPTTLPVPIATADVTSGPAVVGDVTLLAA